MRKITIMDTTLRDGEQAPGFSLRAPQKLEIALQLERMGVDVIEAGFPVASPDDFASVREIAAAVKSCSVAAFGRATEGDVTAAWEAVKHAANPRLHLFLATSDIHMQYKLNKSREQVLNMAKKAVTLACGLCPTVEFIAEDATRSDLEFLLEVLRGVQAAGATVVTLADTVGYTTPGEYAALIACCKQQLPELTLGVHCHDDLGMASANALSAVAAGADQIECTLCGIGERAGMTAMEEVVMALKTRRAHYQAETGVDSTQFYRASKLLASMTNLELSPNKAVVGKNAFAHEAGVHQHGMLANPLTYEIMKPQDVGIPATQMVLGKHSGKAALRARLEELGYAPQNGDMDSLFERFKEMADAKKVLNDNDLELLVYGAVKTAEHYQLESFVVNSGTNITATGVVCLRCEGRLFERAATGETPTIAAFRAVDLIVDHSYPLHNFSIQSISEGRTELGECTVQILDGERMVVGRGIHTDIVEASIKAYLSAINKIAARRMAGGQQLPRPLGGQ